MILRVNPLIEKALNKKHSILVLGPRGSGKTFFLSNLIKKYPRYRIINLLNSKEYRKYLLTPEIIYEEIVAELEKSSEHFYIMIDEIQLVPRLLSEVHRCIDEYKSKITFILTGSSARKLKRTDADLLASRAISIIFFPFHSREIDFQKNFSRIIKFGTLPEIFCQEDEWLAKEKLSTYVDTYLDEEIKKETELRNLGGFHKFLEYASIMNGQPVNFSKVAKLIGVTSPTVKEYYSILSDTLIATEIPAWNHSIKKRLQQASKYYFFDNGVLNALTGELSSELRESTFLFGRLFENIVINEIIRQLHLRQDKINYYHYRTDSGQEIDLILQRNAFTTPIAIEIKSTLTPDLTDVSGLKHFKKLYPEAKCFVICRTDVSYVKDSIKFLNLAQAIESLPEILN